MSKARVPVYNTPSKAVYVETEATKGATLGVDLYYNGALLTPDQVLNDSSKPTTTVVQSAPAPPSPAPSGQEKIQPRQNGSLKGPSGTSNLNFIGAPIHNDGLTANIIVNLTGTASGTNAYTLTTSSALDGYFAGLVCVVTFPNANTGAATLNLNSLGAVPIQLNGVALTSGQIPANSTLELLYDGTNFQITGLVSVGPAGATGHGSTTTTAAPSASGGNWIFTVGDTTAFVAFGTPVYCSDGTNSIYGTVVSVISPTQLTVAPTTTTGTVTSIANGSTFTFSGVAGPAGPTGPAGGSSGTVPLASSFTYLGAAPNATAADKVGRMVITIPSGATHPQEFLQTLPATPYTIDVWCEQIGAKPASGDAFGAGIGISDGIKIISFGIAIFSAGTKASVDKWSSTTAYNSQPFSDNSWPISGLIRLRLTDDGTTRKYYTSTNGLDFINVYSEATNTYLTPTKGGIHTYNNSSTSVASKVAVLNFVITNSVLGDAS